MASENAQTDFVEAMRKKADSLTPTELKEYRIQVARENQRNPRKKSQQLLDFLNQYIPEREERSGGEFMGGVRQLANDATLGFSDEAEARVRSLNPFGPTKDEHLMNIRSQMKQYDEDYPVHSGVSTTLSMASPAMLGKTLVKRGLPEAKRLLSAVPDQVADTYNQLRRAYGTYEDSSTVGRGGRLLGTGGTMGAVSGYGYSEAEDPDQQAMDAGMGFMVGGALTPLMGVGLPALYNVGKEMWRRASRTPRQRADEVLGDVLAAEPLDENMAPEGVLMDQSASLQKLATEVAGKDRAAGGRMTSLTVPRQAGAKERVVDALKDSTGFTGQEYRPWARRAETIRKTVAKEKFEVVGPAPIEVTPKLKFLLTSNFVERKTKNAIDAAVVKDGGLPQNRAFELGQGETIGEWLEDVKPTAGFYEDVAFQLRDDLQKAVARSEEKAAADIRGVLQQLYKEIDDQVPEYASTRKILEKYHRAEDAGDLGSSMMRRYNTRLDDALDEFDAMTLEQREAARRGVAYSVKQNLDRTPRTGDFGKLGKTEEKVGALQQLSRPGKREILTDRLEQESKMHETGNLVSAARGSRTMFGNRSEESRTPTQWFMDSLTRYLGPEAANEVAITLTRRLPREDVTRLINGALPPERVLPTVEQIANSSGISVALAQRVIENLAYDNSAVRESTGRLSGASE